MSHDPTGHGPSKNEDSWEGLAQDLFGIEFTELPDSEDIILPEEPSPQMQSEEQPSVENAVPPSPNSTADLPSNVEASAAVDDFANGFGSGLVEDEPEPSIAAQTSEEAPLGDRQPSEPPPSVSAEQSEGEDSEGEESAEETADDSQENRDEDSSNAETPVREDDGYWDALNDWDWSEDNAAPAERTEPRSRPPRRGRDSSSAKPAPRKERKPPTPSARVEPAGDDFPTAADFREEYAEDPDFGFGLEGDDSSAEKSESLQAESSDSGDAERESVAPASEEGDAPQRRRRRRKRRRRSPATSESSESTATESEQAASEPTAAEPSATQPAAAIPESVSDDEETSSFGFAPESEDDDVADSKESSTEKPPARGRRRRRRGPRRQRATTEETVAEESTGTEASPTSKPVLDEEDELDVDGELDDGELDDGELDDGDLDDGEEGFESDDESPESDGRPSYRNVPTWEEAISYLVKTSRGAKRKPDTADDSSKKPSAAGGKSESAKPRSSGRRGRRKR